MASVRYHAGAQTQKSCGPSADYGKLQLDSSIHQFSTGMWQFLFLEASSVIPKRTIGTKRGVNIDVGQAEKDVANYTLFTSVETWTRLI